MALIKADRYKRKLEHHETQFFRFELEMLLILSLLASASCLPPSQVLLEILMVCLLKDINDIILIREPLHETLAPFICSPIPLP